MTKNRGRGCPCGAGRGFPSEYAAQTVYHQSTKHLGLTRAPDFYRCENNRWHWNTKELAA
jgi:hypothetical protein